MIRELKPEQDYPTLRSWWLGHEALPVPDAFLGEGFMCELGDAEVAACFLYYEKTGRLAMIEYITTNPAFSHSKSIVKAFKELLLHVEQLVASRGCGAIISMVAPGTSEERILSKLGYSTSTGEAHRMYGKVLKPV